MKKEVVSALKNVDETLNDVENYYHAYKIINYDQETICPKKAMEEQGEVNSFISLQAFKLLKNEDFIKSGEVLFANKDELNPLDSILADNLHRDYIKNKNITPAKQNEFSLVYSKGFVDWMNAKEKKDFSLFAPSLKKIVKAQKEYISLRDDKDKFATPYDVLLSDYERGMSSADLDEFFSSIKDRLLPLLKKIQASDTKIRTDFMNRIVSIDRQAKFSTYLMKTIGFDLSRGALATTEHPFTDGLGKNDARITTHYYEDNFISNVFTIVHEGGHAIFEQNQPEEDYAHHIADNMSMGMHESVSRFFENRLGRSRAFIHLIYPEFIKEFKDIFPDVTEEELYRGINEVKPTLIRTDSDEFTYTFHIIIRYEIEKKLINEDFPVDKVPELWSDLYYKYLGIRPQNDKEGVLQDVHWASGFGYFPTYAIGNAFNATYFKTMNKDFDVMKAIENDDYKKIVNWMTNNVFNKANHMTSKEWIKSITGSEFSSKDFLDYLEDKYTKLYNLK